MSTYFIKTFGCQMNFSDSQRLAAFLEKKNLRPAQKMEQTDWIFFNTCGVRQTAENSAMGLIHNLKEKNPAGQIILSGCLAKRKDVQKKLAEKVSLFLPIGDFARLDRWLDEKLNKEKSFKKNKSESARAFLFREKNDYLKLTPKYPDRKKAFVPIMTGCDNFCSYCVVPYARGREISRPVKDIQKEISALAMQDCQEITLLGQNVNSYLHFDRAGRKIDFPALLNLLAQNQPQITFKFLTSHPKDFSLKLMQVVTENKNISKEIHLPIQSGSNKILRLMNRPYTRQHYLNLIKQAQKIIPGVRFTTDIIVGFPKETEKDFLQTAKVLQKVGYNLVFINKYSPRPGTAAEKLGDLVPWEEKKRREKFLRKLLDQKIRPV